MKFSSAVGRKSIVLLVMLLSLNSHSANAGIGLAEWEVKTPGGNFVGKNDWYPECGTCLISRPSEDNPNGSKTLASHLKWWQYYPGYIAGQSAEGFFLLHERSQVILFFHSQEDCDRAISSRHLFPTSKPLTAQDGWNQMWEPILQQTCHQAGTC